MKLPRRMDTNGSPDAYKKLQRGTLRYASMSEEEFRALERERPRCVVVEGTSVLAGLHRSAAVDLQYAFPDRDAFTQHFPSMLERLLPAVHRQEAPLGVRFRLVTRPERAFVEPVLFAHAFELMREWMRMTLLELPDAGAPDERVAPGFVVRPARLEDAEAIAELDAIAFASSFLTPDATREMLRERHVVRLLEETATEQPAGFLRLRHEAGGTGHVSDVAVHPAYQGRGLGEALLRWALAWFRSEGMRRAALTVNTDNARAIALYQKLGFTTEEIGIDYRRPIDEEEARQVLERRRTTRITVRRRFGR